MIAPPESPTAKRHAKNHATDSGNAHAKNAAVAISIRRRSAVRFDNADAIGRPSSAPAR